MCFSARHPWRACHFLLLAQEKVTKEKGTLAAAVAGHPARRLKRGRSGGSLTARPCADSERARIVRAPLTGFFLRSSPRPRGNPGRAKRGRPGRRSSGKETNETLSRASSRRRPGPSTFLFLLTWVPLWRGGGRTERPALRAGEREGSRSFRCRAGMPCQRNPGRPQRTVAQRRRDTEGAFLLVTSLWASKEK